MKKIVYLGIYMKLYSLVESTGLCTQAFLCEFIFPSPVEYGGVHWTVYLGLYVNLCSQVWWSPPDSTGLYLKRSPALWIKLSPVESNWIMWGREKYCNFGFFLPPTLPFAFQTFIMSSEPLFHFRVHFHSHHSISLPQHSWPLATPHTLLVPESWLPLSALHLSSTTFPAEWHHTWNVPSVTSYCTSDTTTVSDLLPLLTFCTLPVTLSNSIFLRHVTTVPEGPSRAWP